MCIICRGNIYNEKLDILQRLDVSNCRNLTSEFLQRVLVRCKMLVKLDCTNCTSLVTIDLRENKHFKYLTCYNCISLTNINLEKCEYLNKLQCNFCIKLSSLNLRENKILKTLTYSHCTSLTSLDLRENKKIKILFGIFCNSLTSLNLLKEYKHIDYSDCPWISQNEDFINNLQRLIKIQRWYRKLLLIKYMKSREFIEWVYSPTNIGGRLYKKWLLKNLK